MKHSFLDRYSDLNSLMHRLDPRVKFISTLLFILAVVTTPPGHWQNFSLYFLLMLILVVLSRVPSLYILRRSLLVLPFVLMVAIFIPFLRNGEAAVSYNIWLWRISITSDSLQLFWNVLAKAWLSIISLILLTTTTRLSDLLKGMEQLKVPKVMVMLLSFMYRYIFLLVDEALRMKQARDSRNFGGRRLWQIKTVGNMIGTLFIRSYERAERVYAAMASRGFDGEHRTLSTLSFRKTDAYFGISFALILATTTISGMVYW